MTKTKTIAMLVLVAIATIGAIGIVTATQSARANEPGEVQIPTTVRALHPTESGIHMCHQKHIHHSMHFH